MTTNYHIKSITNRSHRTHPDDLGLPGGTGIVNAEETFQKLDEVLGPSDVSYILVKPYSLFGFMGLGISWNIYGHSAMAYRDENGNMIVLNIEGKSGERNLIAQYSQEDYFFGTTPSRIGQQKGVWNRDMIVIRIKNVPIEKRKRISEYVNEVMKKKKDGNASFNIVLGPIFNTIKKYIPGVPLPKETGNCAWWVSKILRECQVLKETNMMPKSILLKLFEEYKKPEDVSTVYFKCPQHVTRTDGVWHANTMEGVAPFQPFRQWIYGNFGEKCDCKVEVVHGTRFAIITHNVDPIRPNKTRNLINGNWAIAASVVISAIAYRRIARTTWGMSKLALFGHKKKAILRFAKKKMSEKVRQMKIMQGKWF